MVKSRVGDWICLYVEVARYETTVEMLIDSPKVIFKALRGASYPDRHLRVLINIGLRECSKLALHLAISHSRQATSYSQKNAPSAFRSPYRGQR